ncbi:MAG: hypothetical protein GTO63_35180, partial [Anaerolineae bacterium]|nr:hypothetical protein [Anaerolineae bacterium]NIN99941.1 hypothetical protein [Anaerolineae bacterium]NIQ82700.1 hypothetical protein [Anaerolineae bacterium]
MATGEGVGAQWYYDIKLKRNGPTLNPVVAATRIVYTVYASQWTEINTGREGVEFRVRREQFFLRPEEGEAFHSFGERWDPQRDPDAIEVFESGSDYFGNLTAAEVAFVVSGLELSAQRQPITLMLDDEHSSEQISEGEEYKVVAAGKAYCEWPSCVFVYYSQRYQGASSWQAPEPAGYIHGPDLIVSIDSIELATGPEAAPNHFQTTYTVENVGDQPAACVAVGLYEGGTENGCEREMAGLSLPAPLAPGQQTAHASDFWAAKSGSRWLTAVV